MATTSSKNMKGFYRQKKTTGGITKKATNTKSPKNAAALSSNLTAFISHASPELKDDFDGKESVLRQFDMNMAYGPCLGMSRQARWERANRLGLNPPKEIEVMLNGGKVQAGCLWDGRI